MKKNLIIAIAIVATVAGISSCSDGYSRRTTYYGYSRPDVVATKKPNDTIITRRTIAVDTLYDSRTDDPSSSGAATVTTTTKEVLVYEPSIFTEYNTDHSYYFYQRDYYDPEVLVSVNTGYYSGFSYHPTVWVSVGNSSPWNNPWFSPWYDPWYSPWYRPHYYGWAGYYGWDYYDSYYYCPHYGHSYYSSGFYSERPVRDIGYSRNYAQNASGVKRVQRPGTMPAVAGSRGGAQNASNSGRTVRPGQAPSSTSSVQSDRPTRTARGSSISNGIKNVGTEVKPTRDARNVSSSSANSGTTSQPTRVRKSTNQQTSGSTPASQQSDKPIRIKKIDANKQSGTRNQNGSGVRKQDNSAPNRTTKPSNEGTREQKKEIKEEKRQEQPRREERQQEQPRRQERSYERSSQPERSAPSQSSPSRGGGNSGGSNGGNSGGSRRR